MSEIWKLIKNFPKYEVSNQGRVKSHYKGYPPRFLKFGDQGDYDFVNLYNESGIFPKYVHRLVLEAFVSPCPQGCETNHKDGDKRNNKDSNLEWITRGENLSYALRIGLKTMKGIMNPSSKLRKEEVLEIRRLAEGGVKRKILKKMFKVSPRTIDYIVTNETWNHI